MTSDSEHVEVARPKRPASPIAAGLLGAIFVVACPLPPPHIPGIVLGALIGGAVAGARTKAGLREAGIIGGVMGLVVALLVLFGTAVIALVSTLVPPESFALTPFADLNFVQFIGVGLLAAIGYGILGFGISYVTGFFIRQRGTKAV